MPKKYTTLAIAYDFDGTLAPGNMQERDFIPAIGMTKKKFWDEVSSITKEIQGDNILVYMRLMLQKAEAAKVPVRRKDFEEYGAKLEYFKGVLDWFDQIDAYGKSKCVNVEHYIISSGLREMIQGSKIARKFRSIYASSFWYDENQVPRWPAIALNYTTKTQFLFRINKGMLDVSDTSVNKYVEKEKRPIPFENIVYIGDGETDVPCFRLVKEQGGHSIAVYKAGAKKAKAMTADLNKSGRVNAVTQADYREGKALDIIMKGIIDKTSADAALKQLTKST